MPLTQPLSRWRSDLMGSGNRGVAGENSEAGERAQEIPGAWQVEWENNPLANPGLLHSRWEVTQLSS